MSLLLLVQAGAGGPRPATVTPPMATGCAAVFRVAFVTDLAGLRSSVDAAGWRGVGEALRHAPCAHADLGLPSRPSLYRQTLQAYASADLVIAGSFLLTEALLDVARANPATRFVLVDPIAVPEAPPNVQTISFRADQAAFLAGALAALVTRTGAVAGVYGPDGSRDRIDRAAFAAGARYVRPDVRVLAAFQPAGGAPYDDPEWGMALARAFAAQQADVIFGAGGATGAGALRGAELAGAACIGEDVVVPDGPPCLLATSLKFIDRGVALSVAEAIDGRWRPGPRSLGLKEQAVGLTPGTGLAPEVRERLRTIADLLAAGMIDTGV